MQSTLKIVSFDYRVHVRDALLQIYRGYNIEIDFCNTMTEAIEKINRNEYSLMFIYSNDQDYLSPFPLVRALTNMPVITLSKKYDSDLLANSISAGVDAYFQEPNNYEDGLHFGLAQMRRYHEYSRMTPKNPLLFDKNIILNQGQRKLFVKEKEIELTRHEYELINLLFSERRMAMSYDQIYENVYHQYDNDNCKVTVQTLMKRLREKIRSDGAIEFFRTIPGYGYAFEPHNIDEKR